ncbi:MAG TPA: bifunctional DNA primase/polymerase [Chloroflexia bacterium]|nr:bifunctional DNA primase/polymerase [Chloroflexia bacterium]
MSAATPTIQAIQATVKEAYKAGICIVPPLEDGSKQPEGEWKQYQSARPPRDKVLEWYADGRCGVGFIGGLVSGGLTLLEFDDYQAYGQYKQLALEVGLGGLIGKIEDGYLERTPGGGIHWLYRCSNALGNTKLARRPKQPDEMKHPSDKIQVLIETRGEGGYMIVAPSGGKVHPSGRPYELLQGGISTLVVITPEEQELLWELARSFDQMPREEAHEQSSGKQNAGADGNGVARPGDAFNRLASWEDTGLYTEGWQRVYESGGITYLRRPGKREGISASINYKGSDLFYAFTTSTEFEPERGYSKFSVYTKLKHKGDFAAAASELNKRGYGGPIYGKSTEECPTSNGSEDEPAESSNAPAAVTKTQSSTLVELVHVEGVELWHTPEKEAFATLPTEEHKETWPIRERAFKAWLSQRFYNETGRVPGAQALQDAIISLEGEATYQGKEREVYVRLARDGDIIYLDLAQKDWKVVELRADGWQVIHGDAAPVRFKRPKGMLHLPIPERGGSIEDLRPFVNFANEEGWVLFLGVLIGAFKPEGPYPLAAISGEQGTAKSTLARIIRSLVDPNKTPLRAEPRNGQDLILAATNAWMPTFDNLSHMSAWLSDALCRLSTGGGYATRELYSGTEETIFEAQRPVMLTSITDVITRPDLLDRGVILLLQPIPDDARMEESRLWANFEAVRPRILGVLLDAVCMAIKNLPNVRLKRKPRMADFAMWVTAAEPALGLRAGAFMLAYTGNRAEANTLALEAEPIAAKLQEFVSGVIGGEWVGSASELLAALNSFANHGENARTPDGWPKRPNDLSGCLRRIAPNLRQLGLNVQFLNRSGTKRPISLRMKVQNSVTPVITVIPTPESDAVSDAVIQKGDSEIGRNDDALRLNDGNDDEIQGHSKMVPGEEVIETWTF